MKLTEELRNKQSRDNRALLDRAADRIEELEAECHKQSEWISVKESLPEEFEDVLTCDGNGNVDIGYVWMRGWNIEHVTHWMPLPKAPKTKGGAE